MRKFLLSFLGIIVAILLLAPPVFAENSSELMVLPQDEIVDEDYFSFGKRVEVNGEVNGDAYLMGGEVIVNGTINGDLLAGGGNIVISGDVTGDVRVGGANVTFSGADISGNVTVGGANVNLDSGTTVDGSVVAGSANLQIFSPIGKGANIGGSNVSISNSVGGNLNVGATNISLSPDAEIDGDFTYYSENEANISEGAVVNGDTTREAPDQANRDISIGFDRGKSMEAPEAKDAGIAVAGLIYTIKIVDVFWLIIFGLLLIYIYPRFSKKTAEYSIKKIGWSLLAGFALFIILPVAGILLMITLIGIPVSFIVFFMFFLLFWLGRIFVIYGIGLWIMKRFIKKEHKGAAYIIGMIIYILLNIIPVLDFVVSFIFSLAGIGALIISKGQLVKELREKKLL